MGSVRSNSPKRSSVRKALLAEAICDTSPLQYLHQIKHLDVLPSLATRVLVPPAVVDELREGMRLGLDLPDVKYPGLGRGPAPRGRVRFTVGHGSRARRKRSA